MSLGLDQFVAQLTGLPKFIHDQLLYFSHGDINLTVSNATSMPNAATAGNAISALQLHNQLLALNQNPLDGPVHTICVLFAHSYSGLPGAFGIMFDRGFATSDDPNTAPTYVSNPRQGCAVFLGRIAAARSPDQFSTEALFTTVHEIGHMFNLQHDETSLNFMRVSDPNQSYGPPAYHFTPYQQSRLESCSTDPNVMPGASIFESDGAYNLEAKEKLPTSEAPQLEIVSSKATFWRFEPIQLEISLSLGKQTGGGSVSVPAMLDPSHDQFRLMIENDRGERTLYRSPYKICSSADKLSISAETPYQRDFPIFGQSGGYTFRRAGRHVIWAELDIGDRLFRSNEVAVEVRREVGLNAQDRELRSVLSQPDIARLLFHREDVGEHIALRKLARYVEQHGDVPSAGEINYTLARAILKSGERPLGSKTEDHAKRWLDRALEDDALCIHARGRATALHKELDRNSAPKTRRGKRRS